MGLSFSLAMVELMSQYKQKQKVEEKYKIIEEREKNGKNQKIENKYKFYKREKDK